MGIKIDRSKKKTSTVTRAPTYNINKTKSTNIGSGSSEANSTTSQSGSAPSNYKEPNSLDPLTNALSIAAGITMGGAALNSIYGNPNKNSTI